MELDQLKKIWQQEPPGTKEDQQLVELLHKRSNNPIARMKRNLFVELIAIVVLYGVMIVYYAYAFEGTMSEVSWYMIIIALSFLLYYYMKNRLLNKMECVACQVKSNLQRQVSTLEKYVKFYLIAGTALAPITIIFFGWLFYIKFPGKTDSIFYHSGSYAWWQTTLAWLVFFIIFTVPVYYANKWYVKRLYGRHVQKLKELLSEMNEA